MKHIYTIDENGFIVWERYRTEPSGYEPGDGEIDTPIPAAAVWYKPRWDGAQWTEGGSADPRAQLLAQISSLKQRLSDTDYKSLKAFEGNPSADWPEIKASRQQWRDEINALEAELGLTRQPETEPETDL